MNLSKDKPRASSSIALEVTDFHKHYRLGDNTLPVLKGINLFLKTGEMVAIMGPSGSGKTTLLNCMSGIDIPDRGELSVAGETVNLAVERDRTQLRRYRLGIVFQFFNLIPTLNVRENIALPFLIGRDHPPDQESRISELLETIGLEKRAGHYPFQLSGGEMQLVSIARALVRKPEVVLADEPTGNVNPSVGRSIMKILRTTAKSQQSSVMLVTHSPEHASWADRVCFIKEGVIADQLALDSSPERIAPIYDKLLELEI
ncbi:MAG: ABC transporter ATP-binding protein [Methylococcaceae bacterium]|nr:ABC transporter ATP-binding protein [Methylococcaceae bacterium]